MTTTEKTILAVVDGIETSSHVLEAAVEQTEEMGASLVILHVMPLREYEGAYQSLANSPDLTYDGHTFNHTQAEERAKSVAERAAKAVVADRDVPYTAIGRVGGLVSTVLATAAAHDCEMIVLPATTSWWGHRVGRPDRRIAKRFDGTVVRVPRPVPENLKTTRPLPEA